jgi:hypothetical protein
VEARSIGQEMMPPLASLRESSVRLIHKRHVSAVRLIVGLRCGPRLRGAQSLCRPVPAQVSKTLLQRASPVQFALF